MVGVRAGGWGPAFAEVLQVPSSQGRQGEGDEHRGGQ